MHRYRWDIFSDWQKGGQWTFNSLEGFLQAGPEEPASPSHYPVPTTARLSAEPDRLSTGKMNTA